MPYTPASPLHTSATASPLCARNIPLATYSAKELSQVEGSVSPSDFVRATVGVDNVCERAALVGGGKLIFPKLAHGGVTVAFSKATIELSFKERGWERSSWWGLARAAPTA